MAWVGPVAMGCGLGRTCSNGAVAWVGPVAMGLWLG